MKCYYCKVEMLFTNNYNVINHTRERGSWKCSDKDCIANNDGIVILEVKNNGNYIFPILKSEKIIGWIETFMVRNETTFFFKRIGIDSQWLLHTMKYIPIREDNDFDVMLKAVCKSARKMNIFK